VLITTERELEASKPRHDRAIVKPPRIERLAASLEGLFRLGRPTTAQPI
jgi:hypothetical protein